MPGGALFGGGGCFLGGPPLGGLLAGGASLLGGSPWGGLLGRGAPSWGGCLLPEGVSPCWGVPPSQGCLLPGGSPYRETPPVDRITDTSKTITLTTTSLRPGNKQDSKQNPCTGNAPFAKCAQTLIDVNAKGKPAKKCGSL